MRFVSPPPISILRDIELELRQTNALAVNTYGKKNVIMSSSRPIMYAIKLKSKWITERAVREYRI